MARRRTGKRFLYNPTVRLPDLVEVALYSWQFPTKCLSSVRTQYLVKR